MGSDQDDVIFIPLSAFQTRMQRGLGKFVPGRIFVSAVSPEAIPRARQEIGALLRERHRLGPEDEDDFSTSSMAEMTSMLTSTQDTVTTLLFSVALVSLVVGGIGVMNIMLVSVTERTREIGIRMAVGAQPADIMAQFLVEALVLAAIGGALGVIFGVGCGYLLAQKFGWTMVTRTEIVVGGAGGQRGRRRCVRAVSGAQGVAPRSHRGAAVRVMVRLVGVWICCGGAYTRRSLPDCTDSIAMKISSPYLVRDVLLIGAVVAPLIIPSRAWGANSRIRVGQIGCGRIAQGHDMPGVIKSDLADFVAVCDLDCEAARRRREDHREVVRRPRRRRRRRSAPSTTTAS